MGGAITERFHGEQGNGHPGPLTYPGINGVPVLGRVTGLTKDAELDDAEFKYYYLTRSFRMWEPQDVAEYNWVMERVVNGWFKVFEKLRVWNAQHHNYWFHMEWGQLYGLPPAVADFTAFRPASDAVHLQGGNR